MAPFVSVNFSAPCPSCQLTLTGWQSHDGDRPDYGQVETSQVRRWHTDCPGCGAWVEWVDGRCYHRAGGRPWSGIEPRPWRHKRLEQVAWLHYNAWTEESGPVLWSLRADAITHVDDPEEPYYGMPVDGQWPWLSPALPNLYWIALPQIETPE